MIKFQLSKEEEKIFIAWKEDHLDKHRGQRIADCFGAWVKWSFVPSGLGDSPSVECLSCHERFDIIDPEWNP